ncbi:MAG: type II toxin-antitoxin system HicA family toxin [Nitrososphaerales archaeon]
MPVVSGRKVVKALSKVGFEVLYQKGSHVNMKKDDRFVTVPLHRELDRGTLTAIIAESGMTKEEFVKLLWKH